MRCHEISPENATSIDAGPPPIRLIAVPICCTCIAPVAKDRYEQSSASVIVKINGMIIGDADIRVLNYEEDGREVAVEFTATVPVFAEGIMPSIELARLPRIEFVGWVIGTAFAQDNAQAARAQWRQVADQLRPRARKLAELMDDAETDVLAYMDFPATHRAKLHSTNPIARLIGAILLEQNDEWAVQRSRC